MAGRLLVANVPLSIHDLLRAELGRMGWKLLVAVNGIHALELYQALKPDLVIVNRWLPDMSGARLVRSLRDLDPSAQPILLSQPAGTDELQEAERVGVSEILQAFFASVPVPCTNSSLSSQPCVGQECHE